MCQLLQSYFYSKSTTFTILQRAQFCTNLEYTLKSYHGYFKRSIFQTVNQGGYQVKDEVFGGAAAGGGFQFSSEMYLT